MVLAESAVRVIFTGVPIFLECQRCTACCRWPGQVRLTPDEIARIAAFKHMAADDFIRQFTRLTWDRSGLALLEKDNHECIFLDGNDCAIQPVKPQQCRDFPNLWNFAGADQICRALPHDVDETEYVRRVAAATSRSPASVREILERRKQK